MKLLISGLPHTATLDEVKALVFRDSHADCRDTELIGEADEHPAVLIAINGANWTTLNNIRRRLHGMLWPRCRLSVQVRSFWDVSEAAEARRQTRTALPRPI
jgi:hypothetical protein